LRTRSTAPEQPLQDMLTLKVYVWSDILMVCYSIVLPSS
jgi:hypothetical protein